MPHARTVAPAGIEPSWWLVARYLERAEREHGITRKDVYLSVGVSSPALTAWSTGSDEEKIPLPRIAPLAKVLRMTAFEQTELAFTRLLEKDGKQLTIDVPLLTQAFGDLLPSPEEEFVLTAYREAFALVPFQALAQDEYRVKLKQTLHEFAQKVIRDHMEELGAG